MMPTCMFCRTRLFCVVFVLQFIFISFAYSQTTWYVDDDAPNDPGPGNPSISDPLEDGNAAHPFDAIQEGVNAAVNGDTVLAADGTYIGAGNRGINFGGRLITLGSQNGPESCIIDCENTAGALSITSGESELAVVQGFTIQNGSGLVAVYIDNSNPTVVNCRFNNNAGLLGGAILLAGGSSRIVDCVFTGNTPGQNVGGGMYCSNGSNPTLVNCQFFSNSANYGGGMFCTTSDATVIGCLFAGNSAQYAGGGLYLESGQLEATDCVFAGNRSGLAGGGLYLESGQLEATDCVFAGNRAGHAGGGISVQKGAAGSAIAIVDHCLFVGNTATPPTYDLDEGGGGIHNSRTSSVNVTNCLFSGNLAHNLDGFNYTGAAMYNYNVGNVTIANSLFVGNAANGDTGNMRTCPGVQNVGSTSASVTNCTLADNDTGGWRGSAVVGAAVCNCVAWNPRFDASDCYDCTITYSDIRLGAGGIGTISLDPNFVGGASGAFTADGLYDPNTCTVTLTDAGANWMPGELIGKFVRPAPATWLPGRSLEFIFPVIANTADTMTLWADARTIQDGASWIASGTGYDIRDYHLLPVSPCIDTGDPLFTPQPDETDFDGLPRLADGDCNDIDIVDMGAYEFSYAYLGDFNNCCDVNLADFAILSSAWLTGLGDDDYNPACDISMSRNQFIDSNDLAVFIMNWLREIP